MSANLLKSSKNPNPNSIDPLPLPPVTSPPPIVKMGDDPTGASIISYNVPEPTTYFGNMYFEIPLARLLVELADDMRAHTVSGNIFKEPPPPFRGRQEAVESLSQIGIGKIAPLAQRLLYQGYNYGKIDSSETDAERRHLRTVSNFIYLPPQFEGLAKIVRNIYAEMYYQTPRTTESPEVTSPGNVLVLNIFRPSPSIDYRDSLLFQRFQNLVQIDFAEVEQKLLEGNFLVIYRGFSGQYDYKFVPIPDVISPKLFIIEKYKLSSFLGNYGAGRTLKTFSLLPGEKIKISVKTFRKSAIKSKMSASILDSYSQESASDFEDTLNRERSNKRENQEKSSWHAEAEAEGSFLGFGGSAGGGTSGESAAQREDIAKSVRDSVTKHSQKASAQRDISIDTSYERKEETGEEISLEREIENINVGRTLNFVFRQMNQEYLTLLHLVDAAVGYTSGLPGSFNQGSISNLDDFLSKILENQYTIAVAKRAVVDHLIKIVNYKGEPKPFIEPEHIEVVDPLDRERVLSWDYIRVSKDLRDTFETTSGLRKEVNGVILSGQVNVMRTEGVFVEALLGQGDALDHYSHGLQEETVREKQVANDLKVREAEKMTLANSIIANNEVEKAKLFEQVYPCTHELIYNCNDAKLRRTANDEPSDA